MMPYYQDASVTLYHGDALEVLPTLDAGSVQLLLTDPPYDQSSLHLYGAAAEFGSPLLAVGGHFVCYAATPHLAECLAQVSPHLRYWWTIACRHAGTSSHLPGKWVRVQWKPLLWFVKERRTDKRYVPDFFHSGGMSKANHPWEQSVVDARWLIAHLTRPGGLVIDPYCGSGTVLRAALDLGRRAIGVEVEEQHCLTTIKRLQQQVLPLEPLETMPTRPSLFQEAPA